MAKIKVAVLFGGISAEHEVSVMSANSVMENLDKSKFDIIPNKIFKDGRFVLQNILQADVVFPVLHGPGGEDGSIQGLCEALRKPYVGAGIKASAVALDKVISKQIWQKLKLPVPYFTYFSKSQWHKNPSTIMQKILRCFDRSSDIKSSEKPLVFIKPANTGSSIGISKVVNKRQVKKAIEKALKYHDKIIVEQAIGNLREFEIAVLGNEDPIVSIPCEIIPKDSFYTYRAKYDPTSGTQFIIPANLSKQKVKELQKLALAAYKALDCQGMARVDFFMDKDKIILNEINTIPGFTKMSVFPMCIQAMGISYQEMLTKLIDLAFER